MNRRHKKNDVPKEEDNVTGGARSSIGPSFFYEDEIFRINKVGDVEFGMVTENWDMYSSDDDDEEEDGGRADNVPHGCVAVTWLPKSKDEIVQEKKVQLSDRSLMPGDVVRRLIAGKDTQRGYCRSVRVMADVQVLGTKKVIVGVPATNLVPVQLLQPDLAVYLDSWIGIIRDAKYRLKLKFADGTTCFVDGDTIRDTFEEIRSNSEFPASDVFFPGQKLRGRMKHLKDAEFTYAADDLKRSKDRKLVNVVVLDVQPTLIAIQWQWQTPGNSDGTVELKTPAEDLTGEDIKRIKCLNLFESCTVQISDVSYYTPSQKDTVIEKGEWNKKVSNKLRNECNKQRGSPAKLELGSTPKKPDDQQNDDDDSDGKNNGENDGAVTGEGGVKNNEKSQSTTKKVLPKVCTRSLRKKKLKKALRKPSMPKIETETLSVVETLHTQSVVDVVWQDGTYEEGMRSIDLYPIHHLDDHEFFPGDFVVLSESNDFKRYGVIQRMDHCGRVALVKWFETYSFNDEQKPKLFEETEMSVYDIKDHPDFRFRPGTIVIRVANWISQQCPAGQILDNYPDGQVRVWWANGVMSSCWPQDLFRLGDYDSDEGEMWDDHHHLSDTDDALEDEDNGSFNSDSSWETEDEDGGEHRGTNNEAAGEGGYVDRYLNIGKLIERIQTTLVSTREAIVASSNVSVQEDSSSENVCSTPVTKLGNFDERGLTKKLLMIYKDCQYLDTIMETKFFDVEDLKKWRCANDISASATATSARSLRIFEQISRLFYTPFKGDGTSQSAQVPQPTTATPISEVPNSSEIQTTTTATATTTAVPTASQEQLANPTAGIGMVLYGLCSVILQKLVEAHKEYENRFGKLRQVQEQLEGFNTVGELNELPLPSLINFVEVAADASTEKVADGDQVAPATTTDTTSIDVKVSPSSSNFFMMDSVPDTHRYRLTSFAPQNQRQFLKTVQRETMLLRESLPIGILVKGFEDRMDLYSVMIEGPEKTPYEDGLFLFDIHLPPAYPSVPPLVHYIAFCTDRLNPNLYEEGKVCVSLLGTWNGKGTEVWTTSSSLLQLLVSIQGLILGPEPYYNEAGYEKQKGTQQGAENSRMYNENVLIKLVQSMSRMIANPAVTWKAECLQHIKAHGPGMVKRYKMWLELSGSEAQEDNKTDCPPFPLFPVSKGFKITLSKSISSFDKLLASIS